MMHMQNYVWHMVSFQKKCQLLSLMVWLLLLQFRMKVLKAESLVFVLWPWVSYLTSLSLSFLFCKIEVTE